MIRIRFITGAGKVSRQKYDDGAAKAVSSTLRRLGYVEDHGASAVLECAGSYKLQHDTAKNLKTVVVFPKITLSQSSSDKQSSKPEPLLPEDSPGYKMAIASMNLFKNMVTAKCPSWTQKKGCLECLQALKEVVHDLDAALIKGRPLNESEQAFYDECVDLQEKEAFVRQQAQQQVESGKITKFEQQVLLQHNAERIAALEKESKSTTRLVERRKLLESIDPIPFPKLKHQAQIGKLRKELSVVSSKIGQQESKGRLLTLQETQLLARKEELEVEIGNLEGASRGWFEDDNYWESRLQACCDEHASHITTRKGKKEAVATIGVDTKVKVAAKQKWVTPAEKKSYLSGAATKKKAKSGRKQSVFSTMMIESDDEDGEQESGGSEHGVADKRSVGDQLPVNETTDENLKKKPKKKRKKAKKQPAQLREEEEEDLQMQNEAKTESNAIVQVGAFLQTYLLPILVAMVGWLIGLLFRKPKRRGGRRS